MRTSWLRVLLLVLLGAAVLPATGCVVRARPVWVVDVAPPAPRTLTVEARPGMVWIDGHWERVGGRWVWRDGYWVRERAGQVWIAGAWIRVGARWEWRPGRWEARAKVRDHRDERPRTRDHR